jgi:hypothetical protein
MHATMSEIMAQSSHSSVILLLDLRHGQAGAEEQFEAALCALYFGQMRMM